MDLFNKKKLKELGIEKALLNSKIERYENEINTLIEVSKNIGDSNEELILENKKLINWIEKILEQFGTMEVHERQRVHIPIYKQAYSFKYEPNKEFTRTSSRTIVIPEIIITKYEDGR